MAVETATVETWLRAHPETPGRVQAAALFPSDDPVEDEVAVALQGWVAAEIAPDREPLDLSRVDWHELAATLLDAQ